MAGVAGCAADVETVVSGWQMGAFGKKIPHPWRSVEAFQGWGMAFLDGCGVSAGEGASHVLACVGRAYKPLALRVASTSRASAMVEMGFFTV